MTKPARQTIPITNLLNDEENPRHPAVENQPEVIAWMMQEYADEIFNLAEDICVHGLSQLETMMAIPSEKQKGKFVVIEGNRRLLACRLLNKPTLAEDTKTIGKFEDLQKKYKGHFPTSLELLVVADRKNHYWMIERRHSGFDEGRGLRPWTAQQKGRAERAQNGVAQRYEMALQIIDYAADRKLLGDDSKRLTGTEFNTTNLERLLADGNVRHKLGISFEDGNVQFLLNTDEINKGLRRVLSDVLDVISVSEIKNADQRREYIDKLGDDTPDQTQKLSTPVKARDVPVAPKPPAAPRSKPHGHKRAHIIDASIRVEDANINKVYHELKKLPLDFPAACAALIRIFLEQSLDHYIKDKRINVQMQKGQTRATLKEKIVAVSQSMNAHSLLDKALFKALEDIRNGKAGLADPDHLHMHLHSKYHYPKKQELIDVWDSHYGPFLTAIWKDLR